MDTAEDFKNAFIDTMNVVADGGHPRWFQFCVTVSNILFDDSIWWSPIDQRWIYSGQKAVRMEKQTITLDNLQEIYDLIKPVYGEQYLVNGNLYVRRGYLGTEK